MNTSITRQNVTVLAVQNSPEPPIVSLVSNPLFVQGGIAVAVMLSMVLLVNAFTELIKASRG